MKLLTEEWQTNWKPMIILWPLLMKANGMLMGGNEDEAVMMKMKWQWYNEWRRRWYNMKKSWNSSQ